MIVGTAGHIDHGKTSLVRALTGIDTDRLKEEKARGITIDLGFAYMPAGQEAIVGFVDVPGHERFVHTMLAGATGIDFVLLVVAADDGPKPQTLEHLAILDLLGLDRGLVALTKTDLVPPERQAAVAAQVAALLAKTRLAGSPVLPVSATTGAGVADLRERLGRAAASEAPRGRAADRFRLAVDRSFTLSGAGTIVTGTVLSGEVAIGERVIVSPRGLPARVRSIHAQNRPAERGRAGDRCALNLAGEGISKDAIARGDVVLDATLHAPSDRIDAELRLLPGEGKPVGAWFPVRLHHAALELGARVVPLDRDRLLAGETGLVQLVLERPIAAAALDRFVIRDTSAQQTLGGGRFLDLRAPIRRRRTPDRLAQLAAQRHADASHAITGLLASPPHLIDITSWARDRALAPGEIVALESRLNLVRLGATAMVTTAERWAAFGRDIAVILERFHADNPDLQGIGLERLRLQAELRLPAPVFRSALGLLADEGVVELAGSWIRAPGHEVRLSEADEALWSAIRPLLGEVERFRPPRVRDLARDLAEPEEGVRRLLKLASRQGRVDEIAHDHFFLRETTAEMAGIVRTLSGHAPDGFFTAALFRDQVQNGRKVAIEILDFFDRHGVTLRRGDLRKLNRHRLDLFAPPELGTGPS